MPARDRRGAQLAIQIPPELLARLKTYAGAQQRTMAELLRRWIEAGLAGALDGPIAAGTSPEVEQRLQALEAAVKALQREPRPKREIPVPNLGNQSPEPAKPVTPPQNPNSPKVGSKTPLVGDAPPAGTITTAELAGRIGMKRTSLNERLRRAGGARVGLEMEGWRCVGSHSPESGGPPRWLWEKA